jgi:hypothetical protein
MQAQAQLSGAKPGEWMASLTYRSEAASAPSAPELQSLVAAARGRNRRAGITGMLLYDGGRFLQTLEGPPEAVDRLWSSIQRDPRHGDFEVLSQHIVPARLFSGWDLQLYCRNRGEKTHSPSHDTTPLSLTDHVPATARFALSGNDRQLNALIGILSRRVGSETLWSSTCSSPPRARSGTPGSPTIAARSS